MRQSHASTSRNRRDQRNFVTGAYFVIRLGVRAIHRNANRTAIRLEPWKLLAHALQKLVCRAPSLDWQEQL
jgi:hypothetical protein